MSLLFSEPQAASRATVQLTQHNTRTYIQTYICGMAGKIALSLLLYVCICVVALIPYHKVIELNINIFPCIHLYIRGLPFIFRDLPTIVCHLALPLFPPASTAWKIFKTGIFLSIRITWSSVAAAS